VVARKLREQPKKLRVRNQLATRGGDYVLDPFAKRIR